MLRLLPFLLIGFLALPSCATSQVQKARQVSVDVHAVLAAVDDAEMALNASGSIAKWAQPFAGDPECKPPSTTPCRTYHQVFSSYMVTALKAGKALNEGVRATPVSPQAKVDLTTVSAALEAATAVIVGVLPPQSTVSVALVAAKDAILHILPLFLQ